MEDRLVAEYIGKDAGKFMGGNVNLVAAILGQAIGPIWFFYRKSYLIGFGFLILTYIVGFIASTIELREASYVMFFIYLFTANKLYLWDVKRKVNKMMRLNMSEEDIIAKGGTSTVAAVIYVIAFIAFVVIYVSLIFSTMRALMYV